MTNPAAQLSFPSHGGRRPGAGRKRGRRVSHRGRTPVRKRLPVHVVWRVREDVRSLRGGKLFRQLRRAFQRCCEKEGFRLVHFAVMSSHIHLIVEADGTESLSRGMQGLGVSMAKRINLVSQRSGAVVEERFFSRPLRTPREVANAVRYVLRNEERHLSRAGIVAAGECGFTSATARPADPPLTRPPRTWILATLIID